jgi:(1->4)-alpha-D-glucan 1-alpha-D-glucosylmutase
VSVACNDETDIHTAFKAILAALPVYRTYTASGGVRAEDRAVIDKAISSAVTGDANLDTSAIDFIRRLLTVDQPDDPEAWLSFVMRWQQYTSPVAAKGVEDTAFYRYNVLLSANEVGADPGHPVTPFAQFSAAIGDSVQHNLSSLNTTSTHDTKRSEDVRARLNVLSEIADEWATTSSLWRDANTSKGSLVDGVRAPSARDEYAIYQTLHPEGSHKDDAGGKAPDKPPPPERALRGGGAQLR